MGQFKNKLALFRLHKDFPLFDSTKELGPPPKPLRKSKGLILILDQEELLVELMKMYLEAAGFSAKTFLSADAALAWYSSYAEQVDLIFIDSKFSEGKLLDCLKMFQNIRPESRVALLAEHVTKEVSDLMSQGVLKVFQKPASYPLIINWITEILQL